MTTPITLDDIEALAVGAWILGTGGGGNHVIRATVGSAELQVSDGHGQLVVAHLARPAAGRIYELWIQRGSSAPAPVSPTARNWRLKPCKVSAKRRPVASLCVVEMRRQTTELKRGPAWLRKGCLERQRSRSSRTGCTEN